MFRIGEFSTITMTAITQLRYYDAIGLFQPAYTDPVTDYRYYRMAQVPQLHRILALKALGLTLDQIQRLVAADIAVDEIRGMLLLKQAQVEHALQDDMLRLRNIEIHLQQMTDAGTRPPDGITLKRLPPTTLLGSRRVVPTLAAGADWIRDMAQHIPAQVPKSPVGHFTILFHGDAFAVEHIDIELGVVLPTADGMAVHVDYDDEWSIRQLPAVAAAACALHVGSLDTIIETYTAVGHWIERHHYTLVGPVREVFMTPPSADAHHDTVCELQIPVEETPLKRGQP